jgi:hypothetical protein
MGKQRDGTADREREREIPSKATCLCKLLPDKLNRNISVKRPDATARRPAEPFRIVQPKKSWSTKRKTRAHDEIIMSTSRKRTLRTYPVPATWEMCKSLRYRTGCTRFYFILSVFRNRSTGETKNRPTRVYSYLSVRWSYAPVKIKTCPPRYRSRSRRGRKTNQHSNVQIRYGGKKKIIIVYSSGRNTSSFAAIGRFHGTGIRSL